MPALLVIALIVEAQSPDLLLPLDVVVKDESGALVTNLTKESFTLLESGDVRDIRRFSAPDTPWSIVLLIDHGLPWLQTRRAPVTNGWQPLVRNIERFMAHLGPRDRVAIAAFDDSVQVLMDWKSNQSGKPQVVELNPALPQSTGLKNLYGAMEWAISKLKVAPGRKAVIVLTDGRDGRLWPQWFQNEDRVEIFDPFFGLADLGEAEEFSILSETIRTSGVRFCFMAADTTLSPDFGGRPISGLFPGTREAVVNYISRVRLRIERIARVSGGDVFYGRPDQLITRYERLYDELMLGSRYTLEYSPGLSPEDVSLGLQVRLKEQSLRVLHSRIP